MESDALQHARRASLASARLKEADGVVGLAKASSNLFRDRVPGRRARLDLSELTHVVDADPTAGWVDVEGMITYEDLVAWTLVRRTMPAVVPQLKTITAGGAVAGVGIEATSFRHGLVHDTMLELEVLLPSGEIVTCSPANEHSDLFFGFPNSYGTLGYALRLRLATLPVGPMVRVRHRSFVDPEAFFQALRAACAGDADFVDGVVFGEREHVLSTANFVANAPWHSDYTFENIYYRSLREREEDYLTAAGYLWRWDTDWFWCSRNFGAQNRIVRRLMGPQRLNSRTYTRWMRLNARWRITQRLARLRGRYRETVIQDVDVPIDRAPEFLAFLQQEIGILPLWICPVCGEIPHRHFDLYPLGNARLYVNFGFWDVIESSRAFEHAHFNRLVEREVTRLGGIKSLYSDSFISREEFAAAYGGERYEQLKAKYDPGHQAPHLYDKCVRRA